VLTQRLRRRPIGYPVGMELEQLLHAFRHNDCCSEGSSQPRGGLDGSEYGDGGTDD
jgi:hypothetical protein